MRRPVILLLTAWVASLATVRAELYRCTEPDGSISYTDTACSGASEGAVIGLPSTGSATPAKGQGDDHWSVERQLERMQGSAAKGDARSRSAAARSRSDSTQRPSRPRRVEILNAIRRHQVIPGMTPREVEQAWGPPNGTRSDSTGPRSWSYRGEDAEGDRVSMTVRFKQGQVTGVSGSAKHAPSRFDPDSGRWLE
jgi:hypothetical protein